MSLALRVGAAIADNASEVVIGRDTRTTSELLEHAAVAGMLGRCNRLFLRHRTHTDGRSRNGRVDAGCMITASHNPESYNGLNLLNPDGSSFTLRQQAEIEDALKDRTGQDGMSRGSPIDAVDAHRGNP